MDADRLCNLAVKIRQEEVPVDEDAHFLGMKLLGSVLCKGRLHQPAEVTKARARRLREGFYDKYVDITRPGIDIGCQHDPLTETFRRYDVIFGDGDATYMEGVPSEAFHTVYAGHILEHVDDPILALKHWWCITAPGGHLIVCVPHRDLYEKKKFLPSNWNFEHKTYFLPENHEAPCTRSFRHTLMEAIPDGEIVHFKVCDEGWKDVGPLVHSCGEYQIEAVLRKPEPRRL
jgi:SAM-dependent methyltransferase